MTTIMQPRYIDPYTDYAFKFLFGQRKNKRILIAFLNALLRGKKVIKDLIYLDKEQLGLSSDKRRSVFDVYCEDENGNRFVIEIQRERVIHLSNRAVFYSTYPILEQGVKGEWNHALKEVYTVWILDFVIPGTDPNVLIHEVKLVETATGKVFDNCLTYLYIESPKFTKKEHELETPFDQWLYVLTRLTELEEIPVTLKDNQIFKEFFMIAEFFNMTSAEREEYLASLKEKWDEYSIREAGIVDGMASGRAAGKAEKQLEIAAQMKNFGVAADIISQTTGLTPEQVEQL